MGKRKEIIETGKRFNRLVILKEVQSKHKLRRFTAVCDCGVIKDYYLGCLKTGKTKSCGCYYKDIHTKHGLWKSRLYKIHQSMKQRCFNEKETNYFRYGGRGITVCDEWLGENGFINFYNWAIDNGYKDELTIDRIDNDKGYYPDNCRWANALTQNLNKRRQSNNKSGFTGVSYDKSRNKYLCFIKINRVMKNIGRFNNAIEAVNARNNYIIANNLPHKIQEVTA